MNPAQESQTVSALPETSRRSHWAKTIGIAVGGLVFLLLAAIMIPCMVGSKTAANESSAVGALRTIATAQRDFAEQHPKKGFATTLAELGPSGPNEIDEALASGTKSGYAFTLTSSTRDSAGVITKFAVTASPQTFKETGWRNFFIDESGVIRCTPENRLATVSDPALQ